MCVSSGPWHDGAGALVKLPMEQQGASARSRAGCDNLHVRTIIEPFRIKSVEPLHHTTPAARQGYLEAAGYNLFLIEARHIQIGRAHV